MRTAALFVLFLAFPSPMHASIPRTDITPPRVLARAVASGVSLPLAKGRENRVEVYHPDGETSTYVTPPQQTSLVFRAAADYETPVASQVYVSVEAEDYPKHWYVLQVTSDGQVSLKELPVTRDEVCAK